MVAFVTLEEAKRGMRVEDNDRDDLIDFLILAASQAITNYVKATALDSPSDFTPDDAIKNATIFLVKYWFDDGDPNDSKAQDSTGTTYQLPPVVCALLTPYRTPTLA